MILPLSIHESPLALLRTLIVISDEVHRSLGAFYLLRNFGKADCFSTWMVVSISSSQTWLTYELYQCALRPCLKDSEMLINHLSSKKNMGDIYVEISTDLLDETDCENLAEALG